MARKIESSSFNGAVEALLGSELYIAIVSDRTGEEVCSFEVFDFTFRLNVTKKEELVYTGVEYMGDRESYIRKTYKADIEYAGAVDAVTDGEAEPVDFVLDFDAIKPSIEEDNNDGLVINATIKGASAK